MTPWLLFLAAVLVIGLVLMKTTERFQPEFLDRRQVAKTVAVENSSYAQQTNHMNPPPVGMGPVHGLETPFQVNQYRAFIQ